MEREEQRGWRPQVFQTGLLGELIFEQRSGGMEIWEEGSRQRENKSKAQSSVWSRKSKRALVLEQSTCGNVEEQRSGSPAGPPPG